MITAFVLGHESLDREMEEHRARSPMTSFNI